MAKIKNTSFRFSWLSYIALIILVVLVGTCGHFLGKSRLNNASNKEVAAVQSVSYPGEDGRTALDLLKSRATIETQDSSIGTFVTSVNEMRNNDNHFWMFYVNGELASVGADQYQTKSSDQIEWRFEVIQ